MEAELATRGVSPSPPDFVAWLATARTDEGPFPADWSYIWETAGVLAPLHDVRILKRRQVMMSWLIAALSHYTAKYEGGNVGIGSAGQREADELARKIAIVARYDGDDDRKALRRREYPNGAQIIVLPATQHAGIGYTFRRFFLDEFAANPYAREMLAAVKPAVANGQLVICSTTHPGIGAAGAFYEAWEAAVAQTRPPVESGGNLNASPYLSGPHAVFLGRDVRPDQGAEWLERERAGYSAEEFAAYYPASPEEAFSAPSGLVYRFTAENVCNPPIPWGQCDFRIVGIDIGASDATAIVPLGVLPYEMRAEGPAQLRADFELGRYHVYGESWHKGAEYADAKVIESYLKRLAVVAPIDAIFVDGADPSLAPTLQGMGWPAYVAPKSRGAGLGRVSSLIAGRLLTVSPECEHIRREMVTYWFDPRKDTDRSIDPFATRTPGSEHHADALDALRYAVMGYLFAMPPRDAGRVYRFGAESMRELGIRRFGT